MPIKKDPKSGKWRVGRGKPIYRTRAEALRAQRAVYAKRGRR